MTRGESLKSLRFSRGLSLEQLGKFCGIKHGVLSKIENDKVGLTFYILDKLAFAYKVDLLDIVMKLELDKTSNVPVEINLLTHYKQS